MIVLLLFWHDGGWRRRGVDQMQVGYCVVEPQEL